jgi:hypothetical protein
VFSLEALINQVLASFSMVPQASHDVDRVPLVVKWQLAPRLCGRDDKSPFDLGREPFQSFKELVKYRSDTVHPQPRQLGGTLLSNAAFDHDPTEYPQTKIPKVPQLVASQHVRTAREVVDRMIEWLALAFPEVTPEWLTTTEITLKE